MGKFEKIYVFAPYGNATGGVELAHQLVDYLRNNGENAFIVYVRSGLHIVYDCNSITPQYSKYNISVTSEVEDSELNILILPEVYFEFVLKYKKIRIGCWWMSVDNRYTHVSFPEFFMHIKSKGRKVKVFLSHFLLGRYWRLKNSTKSLKKNSYRIIHLYQSYYAYNHIKELGLTNAMPLSDYINIETISQNHVEKDNIILYNPVKGFAFTKKIIERMGGYNFVALQGFSREELSEVMAKAKLYIDFGEFPGKDRLPRETVMNGCCVVTGKNGASGFYEDVPIKNEYKFDINEANIDKIIKKIKYILENYESCNRDFDHYRDIVKNEKKEFYHEIDAIFF